MDRKEEVCSVDDCKRIAEYREVLSATEKISLSLAKNLKIMTNIASQYATANEAKLLVPVDTCLWAKYPDGCWTCGNCREQYSMKEGTTPHDNGMFFCPRCGRKIEIILKKE